MRIESQEQTPYMLGHKLGMQGKYGAKYLCYFSTRADRLEFCRGYSAGIEAAKRQQEVERLWKKR